ncbi:hypothetical protein V6N12_047958 [Hibiscus sabdariffa]|uniref:C2 NT-type domain-containing protein n=1 Tax=Hibiscus sabdariffa TaxID=183260 RepID=A0ABR2CUY8_9ROSI
MKWRPTSPSKRSLYVKVKPLKLEGITSRNNHEEEENKIVAVEMVWKGPKPRLFSLHKRNRSSEKILGNGKPNIQWDDDEFDNVCDFSVVSGGSWEVLFNVLQGKKRRLAVAGKVCLDLARLVSETECSEIERTLPVTLNVDGVAVEAALFILVSFAEVRGAQSSAELNKEDGVFRTVKKSLIRRKEKKDKQMNSCDSDESVVFDSDGLHGNDSATTSESNSGELSLGPEFESFRSLETQLEPTQNTMARLFSWKKRRTSFKSFKKQTGENCWEEKHFVSRNGLARLKAEVFFASFDQRSERAAGESACTALVAVIAHRLHSNQASMPTRLEFDSLITQGSSQWRKLCSHVAYTDAFPDKHFDLETILESDLNRIAVSQDKSFTGVYIISWNDHFFVLKSESEAYYIIDTLGERLAEGCKQAYMLKFDDSSSMYAKKVGKGEEDGEMEMICSGKECCREYIKRFLAAITVEELDEEEKKCGVSTFSLHRRLQIDFHYTSPSSRSSMAMS